MKNYSDLETSFRYCSLTASFKIVLDPLPALGENATAEDVVSVLGGVADGKLKANVVDVAEYANFRAWLEAKGINHNDVTKSLFAWISYALDTAGLIADEPKEGDLVIDGFGNGAEDGKFELVASVDGVSVGDGATDANLRKVFEVEGASAIKLGGDTPRIVIWGVYDFSRDRIEVKVCLRRDFVRTVIAFSSICILNHNKIKPPLFDIFSNFDFYLT